MSVRKTGESASKSTILMESQWMNIDVFPEYCAESDEIALQLLTDTQQSLETDLNPENYLDRIYPKVLLSKYFFYYFNSSGPILKRYKEAFLLICQ
jgi:hypothetical protein